MKVQGPIIIENLGNLLLDVEKFKDTTSKHHKKIINTSNGLTKQLTTLQEVIELKSSIVISNGIFKTGQEPLHQWRQSLEFMIESSRRSSNELRTMIELVQREKEKVFDFLKVLHIEYQIFGGDKLVNIELMKAKFLSFMD